jgi:hypothetical protein
VRAQPEEATAADALARLLNQPGRNALTPLFVNSAPLPPVSVFIDGIDATPRARALTLPMTSPAGVGLAKSRYRPQACVRQLQRQPQ